MNFFAEFALSFYLVVNSLFGLGVEINSEFPPGADPRSFEELNSLYGRDSSHVFIVRDEEPFFTPGILKNADSDSFVVFGDTLWAKDKNSIYKTGGQYPYNSFDIGSFEALTDSYVKDMNKVCFLTIEAETTTCPIDSADAATFEIVKGQEGYDSQDKNHKYLNGEIVVIPTSQLVPVLDAQGKETLFLKNEIQVWVWGEMPPGPYLIEGADPVTFMPLVYPYSKDANSAYCFERVIVSADVSSFEIVNGSRDLDSRYARDNEHIFWCGEIVVDADPLTFKSIGDPAVFEDAQDKNHKYHWGKIVE